MNPRAPAEKPSDRSSVPAHRLHGVITAMVTPLDAAGALDEQGLSQLIEHQVAGGVHGLFILGSTGEGPQLPDDLYREAARRSAQLLAGRAPLLAGASDNSVSRCLERLECLAEHGVEYGVLTLPYYGWPVGHALSVRFFSEIAARSPIPIIAYNLPKNVGWRMPAELLEELCGIPNLVAIKDTHDDFEQMLVIATSPKRPAHVAYFTGNSFFAARLLLRGADGLVSTPSNIFPKPFVDLVRSAAAGNHELTTRMDAQLISLMKPLITYLPTGSASIKGLLESRGICQRFTVHPWPEATDSEIASMQPHLQAVEQALAAFRVAV